MNIAFISHLLTSSIIFYILSAGFKFFLKLRLNIDFSYIWIILFASYVTAILNVTYGVGMIFSSIIARFGSIGFTIIILYLSKRLSHIYFVVGTLALYMFMFELALNWKSVTGGSLGISGISRILIWNIHISTTSTYAGITIIGGSLLLLWLVYFKKTYIYTLLKWRWENEKILQTLWTYTSWYTLILILLTSLCAVIGGTLYTFYYRYIDPSSFWFNMLILLLVISFISYRQGEILTLLTAICVISGYEYLRFFKIVDPSLLGYVREIIFAIIIMGTSFVTFRTTNFARQQ